MRLGRTSLAAVFWAVCSVASASPGVTQTPTGPETPECETVALQALPNCGFEAKDPVEDWVVVWGSVGLSSMVHSGQQAIDVASNRQTPCFGPPPPGSLIDPCNMSVAIRSYFVSLSGDQAFRVYLRLVDGTAPECEVGWLRQAGPDTASATSSPQLVGSEWVALGVQGGPDVGSWSGAFLIVCNAPNDAAFDVAIDDASITPVSVLFADGFESGKLSAWN